MKVLLWDIDGTLLNTDRAGVHAWMEAAEEIHGGPLDASKLSMAGMTDPLIAEITINDLMERPDEQHIVPELLARYLQLLPEWLPRRGNGFIHRNVREILDHLAPAPGFEHALLTGNIEDGGRQKLAHYGIHDYFVWGAFADGLPQRRDIARRARAEAESRHGADVELYVIGDTPRDIDCGRAVGARTIAVATGGASYNALQEHDAWWLVDHLPEPAEFEARLASDRPD